MPVQGSLVRVTLESAGQAFVIQPGRLGEHGWRYEFRKPLASVSQPFEVVALRQVGWQELPWGLFSLWTMAAGATLVAWSAWQRQRSERRRAEELLRVGQVARLNTLQALSGVRTNERQLDIHIEAGQDMGVLRVTDTGPGISCDTLPHVFEPFFTTREGGLGLGLSLCETLASGMGGQLRAHANVPRGATFILTLPLAPGP